MKKLHLAKIISLILCFVLIATVALITTGCNKGGTENKVTKLGKGQIKFTFIVTEENGEEKKFEISTDKTIVADALLENELIAGEDTEYGLYVKTVDGVTRDYEIDGKYWAFCVNGDYAVKSPSETEIVAGETYGYKAKTNKKP